MARESNWEVWTCDRCGHTIRRKEDQEPPEGWSELVLPQKGAAAVHMDLCDLCAAECQDYLNRRDRFGEGMAAVEAAMKNYLDHGGDTGGSADIRYRTDVDKVMSQVARVERVHNAG